MIVGEAPGEEEVEKGQPFVGYSGQELSRMLHEVGIMRAQCFLTNVARQRPPNNDIGAFVAMRKKDATPAHRPIRNKMCLPVVEDGLELLKREIALVRPNVIVALGNLALWALTGKWGITSWRGSELQTDLETGLDYQPKVIPTYHPTVVLRQWSWRPIVLQDLRRVVRHQHSRELKRPDYRFITRPDFNTACTVLSLLLDAVRQRQTRLAVDIETRAGQIACIGIGWSHEEAICIPLMCTERVEGFWTSDEEFILHALLRELLTHENAFVIGQNFIYDAQYFQRWLLYTPNLRYDTMLAQHVAFPGLPKGLDFLSSMYCEHHVYWKDDGKTWDANTGEDQLWAYNCEDCVRTFEAATVLDKAIAAMDLVDVNAFQQHLFWPVLRTMNRGLRIAHEERARIAKELEAEIAEREEWIQAVVGHDLNIGSAPQMQDLFYRKLGFKPIMNRKTGSISCDDEALRKLMAREPLLTGLVLRIQELRSLGVFLATFVRAPTDIDGRMRCSFNIAGAETFRFSSSKNAFGSGMNLQNVPSGDELEAGLRLPNIRKLFIPDPGYTFFDIDLSSADLRIVVWEANEPEMKAMLAAGLDPYTEIAKEFYRDRTITKKDPRRQKFKSFAHGTNYLGTAKGLAERLGLGIREAEQTQKWYFERFPRIAQWQSKLKGTLERTKTVRNVFGYRRFFFDRIEGNVYNEAAAWIPQSTVACLINRGYAAIDAKLPDVQILLQVHDSLAGQYPTALPERVGEIRRLAEIPLPYADPLTIPVGVKTSAISWGDCA